MGALIFGAILWATANAVARPAVAATAPGGMVSFDDVGAGTLLFKTRRPGRFIAALAGRDFKLAWTLAMRSNFRAAARRLFLSAVGRTRPCLVRRGRIWDISR